MIRGWESNWIEINDIICFPQLHFVTNHKISSFHIFNCSNQDLWAWLPSLDNICQVCDNIVTGVRLFIIISRIITILTAILIKTSSRVFFLTEMNWECFSCFWSRIHFAGDWNYLFSQNLEIFSHFLHKSCQLWECLPVSQCVWYHCLRHHTLLASSAVTWLNCWILAFLARWQLRKQTVQLVGN